MREQGGRGGWEGKSRGGEAGKEKNRGKENERSERTQLQSFLLRATMSTASTTPMERLWARFVQKAMFIILKIRRRSIFSIHEEVEMRRFFDAETSSSSSAGPEPPMPERLSERT